jgi:hypothetical protein
MSTPNHRYAELNSFMIHKHASIHLAEKIKQANKPEITVSATQTAAETSHPPRHVCIPFGRRGVGNNSE